jgi:aspartate/methionine/tyrosine aminotransferase
MSARSFVSKKMKMIPPSGIRVIYELAQKFEDLIRLEIGEPDFDTPEHIKKAAEEAVEAGFTHYTSSLGLMELREAVAEKLRRENGINVDPAKEVIVTSGGCNALSLAIMATIDPGDEVLVPDPYWPQYDGLIRVTGGIPIYFPTDLEGQYKIDSDVVRERISKRTKMLLVNSPNNPTGGVLTKENLKEIAELAMRYDLLLLSDEAYEKIIFSPAKHYSIASFQGMHDRTISAFSFSKSYAMTGWRLGYATAQPQIVAEMAKAALFQTSCPSSISQKAGLAALKGLQDCIQEMVEEYKRRRDFLVRELSDIKRITCKKPDGAFYIFPNMSEIMKDSFALSKFLIEKARVSTTPGKAFGDQGEGYIRISFANSIENIGEALKRIRSALEASGS